MSTNSFISLYRKFCSETPNLPIFYQDWWLDIVCPGKWSVAISQYKDGSIKGIWPYYSSTIMGIPAIFMPPFTPYMGPYVVYPPDMHQQARRYSHEDATIDTLIKMLPNILLQRVRLFPDSLTAMQCYQSGYRTKVRYTYQLNSIKNHDVLWEQLKSNIRNHIKKAEKLYTVEVDTSVDDLYRLNEMTLHRKGMAFPLSQQAVKEMYEAVTHRNMGYVLTARNKDGQAVASCLIVHDHHFAYQLMLGIDKTLQPRGAAQLLIWKAILKASQFVDRYDFEGSMIPEVEPVFRAFGGQRVIVPEITKAPRWAEMGFIIANKSRW